MVISTSGHPQCSTLQWQFYRHPPVPQCLALAPPTLHLAQIAQTSWSNKGYLGNISNYFFFGGGIRDFFGGDLTMLGLVILILRIIHDDFGIICCYCSYFANDEKVKLLESTISYPKTKGMQSPWLLSPKS